MRVKLRNRGPAAVHHGAPLRQIGKWPGCVAIVIQRVSVKLSMPCRPPKRPWPDAAERHLRLVLDGRAVDMADARLDAPRDRQTQDDVAREDGRREAVLAVVGERDRVFGIAGADDCDDGAEAFVGVEIHRRRDAIDHSRGHDDALRLAGDD